jgi:uncharacterized protein with HEPN domain
MREDRERLLDIQEAIEKIQSRALVDRTVFFEDDMLQTWVVFHIIVIGESAGRISQELRDQNSQVPWKDIIDMRNILVHRYFGIDLEEVWDTIAIDIPIFKKEIKIILGREQL